MDINLYVKPSLRIKAFYLFFLIGTIQTGTGVMSAPRYIFQRAEQDAWISVLVAGLFTHLIVIVMFLILNRYENADILGIQVDLFGKWIGKALGTLLIIYLFMTQLSILLNYIEVVQVFIFPLLSPWILGILLISLIVYTVLGGIRIVVGVSFVFFFLALWLILMLYQPITMMDIGHFRPVFASSPKDVLLGSYASSYALLGIELLFFIYPFIEDKKKAAGATHLGVAFSVFLLFLVTVISIGYFSAGQLTQMVWSVLALFKIVQFAIIERFDILIVTEWMMVILPNLMLLMWMITYGMKRLYGFSQKKTLYVTSLLLLLATGLIKSHFYVISIISIVSRVGFYIAFVYPLVLLPIVIIKQKLMKRRVKSK